MLRAFINEISASFPTTHQQIIINQWMNLSFDLFLFLREVWSEKWNNKNTSARHLLFAQVKLPGTEYPCAPWISPLTLVSRNASKTIWLIRVIQFSLDSNIFNVTIQPTFPITSNHQSNSEKSYHEPPTPMQEQLEQFAPGALGRERPPPFPSGWDTLPFRLVHESSNQCQKLFLE